MRDFKTLLILIVFISNLAEGCIVIGEHIHQPVMSRNFDYPLGGEDGYGMILHHPRGYHRQAIRVNSDDQLATWTSKHASISFNLLSPATAQDGMNDAGLAATMTVIRSRFHKTIDNPSIPALTEMELLQYLLDQASSRDDVVRLIVDYEGELTDGLTITKADSKIRLTKASRIHSHSGEANFHWSVCDKDGHALEIDYIDTHWELTLHSIDNLLMCNEDSDLLAHKFDRMPIDALPVQQSWLGDNASLRYSNARYYKERPELLAKESTALGKIVYAKELQPDSARQSLLADRFHQLDRSTDPEWNKWQIVYLPKETSFYFRTTAASRVKKIDVKSLLTSLASNRTTTGVSLHTSFSTGPQATDFTPVNMKGHIHDVLTVMGQSLRIVNYINEHSLLQDKLNNEGASLEHFANKLGEVDDVAIGPLMDNTPSKLATWGVYGKVLSQKTYHYLIGTDR